MLVAVFFSELLRNLPLKPVLAAIVLMAVAGLVNVRELRHLWEMHLLVAEVSAGCRVVVLLFRRHLRDDRLRGFGAAESVASVRPSGGVDWRFDVWVVHGIFIRHFEQNVTAPAKRPNQD